MSGGHVFVVRGDIRRLACSAWAIPSDGQARVEPTWLSWPPGAASRVLQPDPFPHWAQDARRARPLHGWPANLPQPWLLHVELDPMVPRSWLVEAVLDLVAAVAEGRPAPPPGRALPLLAVPLGVAGIGATEGRAARRAAGGLARELLPELRAAARTHGVDIALVAHSDDSLAASQAARASLPAADPLPDHLRAGLQPAAEACRHGRLAALVGPELARRDGVPAWDELLAGLAAELALPEAWRLALHHTDQAERTRVLATHAGGASALARAASERLARAHAGLACQLLAGLRPDPVFAAGPDDLLEHAWSAADRPLDVLLDGPGQPGGARLYKRHGTVRRPSSMVSARVDRGRRRERDQALQVAAQATLRPDAHLLVVGFCPDGELLETLSLLVPLLPPDPAGQPRVTVLAERDAPHFAELWPPAQVAWLPLVDRDEAAGSAAQAERARLRAGRRLELALDRLGAEVGLAARGLDPGLRPLLSEADQALGRSLEELLQRLPAKARQAALWPDLARWLAQRGLDEG